MLMNDNLVGISGDGKVGSGAVVDGDYFLVGHVCTFVFQIYKAFSLNRNF